MKLAEPVRIGEPGEWEPAEKPSGVDGFGEDAASGLLLPIPPGKSVRRIVFDGGSSLDVEETQEEIRSLLAGRHGWVTVTDAGFGQRVSISPEASERILWISEAWIDIEGIREAQAQQEMAKRLGKGGFTPVAAQTIPLNGRRR